MGEENFKGYKIVRAGTEILKIGSVPHNIIPIDHINTHFQYLTKYNLSIRCKMVKLQESKNRFFVSIPKEIIKKKKWVKGDDLIVSFNERGNVEICDVK